MVERYPKRQTMHGYQGNLLCVDLTTHDLHVEPVREDWARQFLGGSGLAARYLYDLTGPGTHPLGPDNALIFMAGPLVGTAGPACGRFVVCARSPATGLWGEANSGGDFGPYLRFAGFDGIIITGQSEQPVYLVVIDGRAELRPASHLWGLDTYQTQARIQAETDSDRLSIACIGPAGEHLVKMAGVINDEGRAAARGGLGAVMGAKRLKAVAVGGRQKIPLADEARFKQVLGRAFRELKQDFSVDMLRSLGTSGGFEYQKLIGDVPNGYWTVGNFEGAEKLSGAAMAESILVSNGACYRCPIACWRVVEVKDGPFQHPGRIDGPEYETIVSFGSLLLSDNLEAAAYASHLCNAYGLDTISAGSTIAFAYYLYNERIIDKVETGGLELHWGDPAPSIELLRRMAFREGFGAILAEGSRFMERRYGVEGLAVQVNGLEVAMHDPRAMSSMALIYATSPRGACHNQGDMYWVEVGRGEPTLGIVSTDRFASEGKAEIVARCQDWRSFYNGLIMCIFSNPDAQDVVDLVAAATGWDIDLDEAMCIGERIWNLKRAYNNRLGLSRANDKLPRLLLQPLPDGGTEGHVPDLDTMLREWYRVRDWDDITGRPTRSKLVSLGLAEVADELWPVEGPLRLDGLVVRRATADDQATLIRLHQAMLGALGMPAEPGDSAAEFYTREQQADRLVHFIATTESGEAVGFAGAVIRTELIYPSLAEHRYGLIMDIYTEPRYRRRGLARILLEQLGLWLRERGVEWVRIVPTDQTRDVLERLGFEQSGEMERRL
jgi:aldehyde:ferredoxin oxidoreductase